MPFWELGCPSTFTIALGLWAALAVTVFVVLLFVPAPYGRLARPRWGATLPCRLSWLLMEAPAVVVVAGLLLTAESVGTVELVFFLAWNVHYPYRTLLYPVRMRSTRRVPVVIALSGASFNVINGYFQGYYLFHLAPDYPTQWLLSPAFVTGMALFAMGLAINIRADETLRSLRSAPGDQYKIPRGQLFTWVSCPNYLGELLEWIGWAVMTWSPVGAVFALWTCANLIPRALASHRWYQTTFADYPPERKAILPLIL